MIIREMQGKLATWATEDKCRRFDRLLRLMAEPVWLQEAARITLASSGAHTPGVDGMTKTLVENRLPQLIRVIREQLLGGDYQPLPARRVYIPKSNGKMRPLGIPTLKDRIVQLESRQWKPAVAYCRYADDFVVIIKGTKAQAEAIKDECREVLESKLKLTLNMEKTHITHVNDGFVFLGHRIIRKRNRKGEMRVSTSIPKEKFKNFIASLTKELSGNYSMSKIDMVDRINRKLKGWSNFYQFTDNTAMVYNKVDRVVFWKLGHWLTRKYRCRLCTGQNLPRPDIS